MKFFVGLVPAILFLIFALVLKAAPDGSVTPYELRVDHWSAPVGLDSLSPNFSWKLRATFTDRRGARQTAWQIRVGTAPNSADRWDSGKVISPDQLNVSYAGRGLHSHEGLFWQVRVWDELNQPSPWSETAAFTLGVLTPADWVEANWITDPALTEWQRSHAAPDANPRANSTLLLRREFHVHEGLQRALLHVSGLGQYSLHLNGRVSNTGLLTPGWTTYEKTILYDSYDVTAQLLQGPNALGLELAGGMFNVQPGRYVKFVSAFHPLTAIAQLRLEYADGSLDTVVTDSSWRIAAGPVTFSNIYGGEDYDARLNPAGWDRMGFDDHAWTSAIPHDGPGGQLRGVSHASPPFHSFEVFKPVSSHELRPGVTVYDLGQNASFMIHLRVRGVAGSKLKIIPSELLREDGSLNRSSVGNGEASWNYILAGEAEAEEWRPSFFYHGCRYLQVERSPAVPGGALPELELIEGIVTHSASAPAGDFACSSDLFNRIRLLIRWAQRSNLAHVITDCPHRERLGWLEQYHLNGPALRYEWDLTQLYSKCFDDMADAQTADGLVPDIAPEFVKFEGGFRDSPEWGSALILAAWQHYVWTADDAPLRRHFDAMQRYFDYLTSKSKDHLLNHGLGDWYDRGPKAPGRAQLTPIALTATAIYYEDAVTLACIATHLGREDSARKFTQHADEIKTAFNQAFLDPATGTYATGSQTAQALPLVLDLVPAPQRAGAFAILLRDIESRGHAVTAGDVGYRYVLRALAEGGRSDTIFAMINQSDKPGYGYQLAHGATTLTEAWDANPNSSQNHFMLGQIMEWFHGDLAGLAPDPTAPEFARVIVKPQPVPGIEWARARHESPHGPILVEWRKTGAEFMLNVELPPNTTGLVYLPAAPETSIQEHGAMLESSAGAKIIRRDGTTTLIEIASGRNEFTSTLPGRDSTGSRATEAPAKHANDAK